MVRREGFGVAAWLFPPCHASRIQVWGLGFRLSGIGVRVSSIGSRVSEFGSRVSGLGSQVSGFEQVMTNELHTLHEILIPKQKTRNPAPQTLHPKP